MAVWRTQINYLLPAIEGDHIQVATWPVETIGGCASTAASRSAARGRRDAAAGTDPLRLHRSRERPRAAHAGGVRPLQRRPGGRGGAAGAVGTVSAGRRAGVGNRYPWTFDPGKDHRNELTDRPTRRTATGYWSRGIYAPRHPGHHARGRICAGRAAGVGADDHDRHRGARRRRGEDPGQGRRDARLSRDAGRPRGRFRSCWSCRRSSASTSTSRTSAGGSPSSATWPSPPSCTPGRATCRS